MSAQKFQVVYLLLVTFFLVSQSTANRCVYRGPCKVDGDCKKICTFRGDDPNYLSCLTSPPLNGQCCCKHSNQENVV
ncbi:hypothetical protein N665_0541s0040 [Sinapis alba]|nr:hypothetical protein N665_0541s0040 [Sinapis alba]